MTASVRVAWKTIRLGVIPNYRSHLGDLDELAQSIKKYGLLNPLLVREGRDENDRLVHDLVDGERRYRAIALIRQSQPGFLDMTPVCFFEGSDADALYARFHANHRRLIPNPIEVVNYIELVLERDKRQGLEQVAKKIGFTRVYVARLMKIKTRGTPRVLAAVGEHAISVNAAFDLVGLPKTEQDRRLDQYLEVRSKKGRRAARQTVRESDRPTRRDMEAMEAKAGPLTTSQDPYDRGYWVGVYDAMRWVLGKPGSITLQPRRNNAGDPICDYKGPDLCPPSSDHDEHK